MEKQNILMLAVFSLITGFTSCSESIINDSFQQTEKEIVLNFGISQLTRTSTSIDWKTLFIDNDQIGVWGIKREGTDIVHENLKYEYNKESNEWTAERSITFPIDGSDLDFYAYYPYNINMENTVFDFSVAQNQSLEEEYNQSDLLIAMNKEATVENTSIVLTFSHQFALVEAEIILPQDQTLSKVDIYAKKTATVNLLQQTTMLKESEAAEYVTMLKVEEKKELFRAIIPAQIVDKGKLFRIITTDGTVYWYKATEKMNFEANEVTTFSIDCRTL